MMGYSIRKVKVFTNLSKDEVFERRGACYLCVSINNSIYWNEEISSVLDWLNTRFSKTYVLIGDYINRYNELAFTTNSSDEALKIVQSQGDEIIKIYEKIIANYPNSNFEILRTEEIIKGTPFVRYCEKRRSAILNDKRIYEHIRNSAKKYVYRSLVQGKKPIVSYHSAIEYSTQYLVEELLLFGFLSMNGIEINVYCGPQLKALKDIIRGNLPHISSEFSAISALEVEVREKSGPIPLKRYSLKTINNHPKKDFHFEKKCHLGVSITSPLFSPSNGVTPKLISMFEWLDNNFDEILILVGDYLNRKNEQISFGNRLELAEKESLKKGERVCELIQNALEFVNADKFRIVRWKETTTKASFEINHKALWDYYNDNKVFNSFIKEIASEYIEKRFENWGDTSLRNSVIQLSIDYILEELAVFTQMFQEGWMVQVYPGKQTLKDFSGFNFPTGIESLSDGVFVELLIRRK